MRAGWGQVFTFDIWHLRFDFVMLQLRRLPGQLTRLLLQTLQNLFRDDGEIADADARIPRAGVAH
jgi:hypothetical protein